MSKYFDDSLEWQEDKIDYSGIPRPFSKVPKSRQFKNNNFFLHPRVPIPWQSYPIFEDGRELGLIDENEKQVYSKNLCPYCGINFLPEETVIRWTTTDRIPEKNGPRVLSDSYPFHINCMKQGRIFCPHMRKTKDTEFEIGPYWQLRKNAIDYTIKIGILKPPTQ